MDAFLYVFEIQVELVFLKKGFSLKKKAIRNSHEGEIYFQHL